MYKQFCLAIQQRPQQQCRIHYKLKSIIFITTTSKWFAIWEMSIFLPIIVQVPHLLRLLFNQSCRYSVRPSFYVHTLFRFTVSLFCCFFFSLFLCFCIRLSSNRTRFSVFNVHTTNPGVEIFQYLRVYPRVCICICVCWSLRMRVNDRCDDFTEK